MLLSSVTVFLWPGAGRATAETGNKEDGAEEIRFVAYNLKNYLRMRRSVDGEIDNEAPKPEDEIRVIVATLARLRPEILGVCEIGDKRDVADLKKRLRETGLEYPYLEWVDGADEERHLALLSQFPIVERNSVFDLTYTIGDFELPVWRGFLDATVQLNDGYRLRCVGAHLKSKREVPEADQALMRRNEAHLLRLHVEEIFERDADVNLLVYGDFNDTRNEVPIRAIQGKFGSDRYLGALLLKDPFGLNWTHHWSYADIYSRIDFIFVSPGLYPEINRDRSFVYHRDDWDKGSDHRALAAAIVPVEK